jgi:hypothetical protein
MAYTSWENASWLTSNADALCEDGSHVALGVVSVAVPNLLNLHQHSRVEAVGVDSAVAASNVVAADSVEEVVGSVEDVEEEALVTEVALVTAVEVEVSEAVEVASEATEEETTLDHREVEAATGRYLLIELAFAWADALSFLLEAAVVVWDTKVEDSMTPRLRAGMEVPLDQAVGLVVLVGTVLLVGDRASAPLEAVVPVVTAATEDISSERVQEDLMTETPSGRDSSALQLHAVSATVSVWYDSLFSFSVSSCFVAVRKS